MTLLRLNKLLLTGLASTFLLAACGTEETESTEENTEDTVVEETDVQEENNSAETEEEDTTKNETTEEESSDSSEAVTAVDWVKEHEGENIDKVIADFEALTDEKMKEEIGTQVAGEETSFFGKKVVVTGKATEFVEGSEGNTKGSFMVETDAGNNVRISASNPNDALDIGEKVEATGSLAIPLGKTTNYFVREASVYIQ